MIGELVSSGRAVDVILLIIAVEFLALSWRGRRAGLRGALSGPLFALAPGACLLLALRGALTGAAWPWVAAWLAASLPLHVGDLLRRGSQPP